MARTQVQSLPCQDRPECGALGAAFQYSLDRVVLHCEKGHSRSPKRNHADGFDATPRRFELFL
jgi:hypothetical protein